TRSLMLTVGLGAVLGLTAFVALGGSDDQYPSAPTTTPVERSEPAPTATTSTTTTTIATTTTLPPRSEGEVPAWTVGRSWGSVPGVTMFRGNPTRTFYGAGPIGDDPVVVWRYPEQAMCATSSVGGVSEVWCGMGWTGQPVVYDREDGVTELIFGAYDRAVHFVDAETGEDLRPPFPTGDIIKGSVTLDPDGYPLLYFGSRDNKLRIVALDRDRPLELWSLDADAVRGVWNNDWDGNAVIVDDVLYEGGENGWLFAYELRRAYDPDGLVVVDPKLLLAMPGYDDELIATVGRNVSIESSVALFGHTLYFTNSGGRVMGLDVSRIREGLAPVIFEYFTGGDIDASPVVDEEGNLYVAVEHEPSQMGATETARNHEVGQLVKLDPDAAEPRVWGLDLTSGGEDSGIWATPALYRGHLYVNTHNGDLIVVDTASGRITWSEPVGWHSWSSPVVVDDTLVVATCQGDVRAYGLDDPARPSRMWSLELGGSCLEATPVVWDGIIYIGSRDGFIRAIR
ncbi:MAG: PQQ-binding-like beta-propeller repeat protein, partial [Actinobacteria bacterium]|nr:PQQ-binding-like beta-propeller repeat protein [Actinomycetota bacterium]